MRVLVTGGVGFIGTRVVRELLDAGHEVRVLDLRADRGGPDGCELRTGDVRDAAAVRAALRGCDAVCHLAARVGLGVGVHDLPDYADHNVHGTAVVLAAMAAEAVGRLVLASSMVVYGEGLGLCAEHGAVRPGPRSPDALAAGRFEAPCPRCGGDLSPTTVDEDVPADPRNAYAASKLAQEHFASSWARTTDAAVVALRYHNVYGPGLPVGTPYAGVAALFRSALLAGRSPRVFEDGGQRRDFVHVADVAAATAAAVTAATGGVSVLNVGSGVPHTVGGMAEALAAATGGPAPVVTGEYRLGDVRHVVADSSRARRVLGWRPTVDLARGVVTLVDEVSPRSV